MTTGVVAYIAWHKSLGENALQVHIQTQIT